jgi:small nuclear ribonucleoprotein (snRNP)-like protein
MSKHSFTSHISNFLDVVVIFLVFFMAAVTLGTFLREKVGSFVVVELKDETAIEGNIVCVDPKSLNIELNKVVLYRRRIKNLKVANLNTLFIKVNKNNPQ